MADEAAPLKAYRISGVFLFCLDRKRSRQTPNMVYHVDVFCNIHT